MKCEKTGEVDFEGLCEELKQTAPGARLNLHYFVHEHCKPGVHFRLGKKPGLTGSQYMWFSPQTIRARIEEVKALEAARRLGAKS